MSYGEKHSTLLDKGLNIASILPPDHLAGLGSSYFGDGEGMLVLEQSPHVEDPYKARLRILGVAASMGTYGDESELSFALSNNVSLPDGTHANLKETLSRSAETIPPSLPENAIAAFEDVSRFVRALEGNVWSTDIHTTTSKAGIEANVTGVFTSDEMQAAYLRSIEATVILDEQENPTTATGVRSIQHQVLTPRLGQLVTLHMSDHRPGSREAMRRLKDHAGD